MVTTAETDTGLTISPLLLSTDQRQPVLDLAGRELATLEPARTDRRRFWEGLRRRRALLRQTHRRGALTRRPVTGAG